MALKFAYFSIPILVFGVFVSSRASNETTEAHHEVKLADLHFEPVKYPLIITLVLLTAALFKLGFEKVPGIARVFPESSVQLIFGIAVGYVLSATNITHPKYGVVPPSLSPQLFFIFLLPPIILEGAFSLLDRVLVDNLDIIIVLAVVGTLFNYLFVGPLLYGLAQAPSISGLSHSMNLTQALVFSSVLGAIDPVAIISVFQKIGVDSSLYFIVFGESLFNDAVTVVLYKISETFCLIEEVTFAQILKGCLAFFTVSFGGVGIGCLSGILCSLVTKFTYSITMLEVLFVFVFAYISYLVADMFGMSGIVALICCGLVQAEYVFDNVSRKSRVTIRNFIHMHSSISDAVIFMFLGLSLTEFTRGWDGPFVCWTIVLCLLSRFAVCWFVTEIFLLCFIINGCRQRKINWQDQFILCYGGLRGAVAFSLVEILNSRDCVNDELLPVFRTTTLGVIVFTVFVQGITIKPVIKWLGSERGATEECSKEVFQRLSETVMNNAVLCLETIGKLRGRGYYQKKLRFVNRKYIKTILNSDYSPHYKDDLVRFYQKFLQRPKKANRTLSDMGMFPFETDNCSSTISDYLMCARKSSESIFRACATERQKRPCGCFRFFFSAKSRGPYNADNPCSLLYVAPRFPEFFEAFWPADYRAKIRPYRPRIFGPDSFYDDMMWVYMQEKMTRLERFNRWRANQGFERRLLTSCDPDFWIQDAQDQLDRIERENVQKTHVKEEIKQRNIYGLIKQGEAFCSNGLRTGTDTNQRNLPNMAQADEVTVILDSNPILQSEHDNLKSNNNLNPDA